MSQTKAEAVPFNPSKRISGKKSWKIWKRAGLPVVSLPYTVGGRTGPRVGVGVGGTGGLL